MSNPKLYSYTIHQPLADDTPINSGSSTLESLSGNNSVLSWDFMSPVSYNNNFSVLEDLQNTNIQPTPYMTDLIDEYFFSSPPSHRFQKEKTPRIFSQVLAGPRFVAPEINRDLDDHHINKSCHNEITTKNQPFNIDRLDTNLISFNNSCETNFMRSDTSSGGSTHTFNNKKRRNSTCSSTSGKNSRNLINKSPRSYSGCYICRLRRIKCDEVRPMCTKCSFRGLKCEFPEHDKPKPDYLLDNTERQLKLQEIKNAKRVINKKDNHSKDNHSNHSHSETE